MMSKITTIILLSCFCYMSMAKAGKTYVKTPDGRVSVEYRMDRKG